VRLAPPTVRTQAVLVAWRCSGGRSAFGYIFITPWASSRTTAPFGKESLLARAVGLDNTL
jgi:hypothetical protein